MKMTVNTVLEKRNLPEVLTFFNGKEVSSVQEWNLRRREILQIMTSDFVGDIDRRPSDGKYGIVEKNTNAYGGKAKLFKIEFFSELHHDHFTFQVVVPKRNEKVAAFLNLCFSEELAGGMGEELIDEGFAVASLYYQDVCPDNGIREKNGAISKWAYGISRVMDYLEQCEDINSLKVAVIGHSRLGKAVLWAGALDTRFSMVIANESGAGGAALFRGKEGEKFEDLKKQPITNSWFKEEMFKKYEKEEELPYDQHFLLALIAPRRLYISSALEDNWSDPVSEYLSCVAATPVYRLCGIEGLVVPSETVKPETDYLYHVGNIGYHIRRGTHDLTREDWKAFITYRNKVQC